jgi:hypothetical protein
MNDDEQVIQDAKDLHRILKDNPDGLEEWECIKLMEELNRLRHEHALYELWQAKQVGLCMVDGEAGYRSLEGGR